MNYNDLKKLIDKYNTNNTSFDNLLGLMDNNISLRESDYTKFKKSMFEIIEKINSNNMHDMVVSKASNTRFTILKYQKYTNPTSSKEFNIEILQTLSEKLAEQFDDLFDTLQYVMEYYLPRYCHDKIMGCAVSVVYGLHNQRFMVVADDKGETDLLSISTLSHSQYTKEEIRTLLFTNVDKLENKLKMLCIGGE